MGFLTEVFFFSPRRIRISTDHGLACLRKGFFHGLSRINTDGLRKRVFFAVANYHGLACLRKLFFFPRIITDYHGWLAQEFFFATVNYQGCSWIGLLAQAF
jgi:hypothetical protein